MQKNIKEYDLMYICTMRGMLFPTPV